MWIFHTMDAAAVVAYAAHGNSLIRVGDNDKKRSNMWTFKMAIDNRLTN